MAVWPMPETAGGRSSPDRVCRLERPGIVQLMDVLVLGAGIYIGGGLLLLILLIVVLILLFR